jgi:hypothetical protein
MPSFLRAGSWSAVVVLCAAAGSAETVRERAGQPVFLTESKTAVELRGADGDKLVVLAEGKLSATYDAGRELVWLDDADGLAVLDLREADPRPVRIVKGPASLRVVAPGEHADRDDYMWLSWTARPTIQMQPGPQYEPDSELPELEPRPRRRIDKAREIAAESIVGGAWLARNLGRPKRAPAALPATSKLELPCDRPHRSECPSGVTVDPAGLAFVAVLGAGCQFYDPASKKYAGLDWPDHWSATPDTTFHPNCQLAFDASGRFFAVDDMVCALRGGCVRLEHDAHFVGWLDPGRVVKLRY